MKIFANKNFVQKVVICFVLVILLNFCFAPKAQAASEFGSLFTPMKKFLTAVADITITIVQWGVTGEWIYAVDDKGAAEFGEDASDSGYWFKKSKNVRYPIIQISPELIFANEIELLDVDFISGDTKNYVLETDNNGMSELRSIIASWYVTLRTISIVGLLSVLIYIGIRIIISSTAQDRAKYKQRLVDWLIAFCLLFVMHYIMAATLTVVDKVNDTLVGGGEDGTSYAISLDASKGYIKYTRESDATVTANENGVTLSDYGYTASNVVTSVANQIKVEVYGNLNYLSNAVELGCVNYPTYDYGEDTVTVTYTTVEDLDSDIMEQGSVTIKLNTVEYSGEYYVMSGSITTTYSNADLSGGTDYLSSISEIIDESGITVETSSETVSSGTLNRNSGCNIRFRRRGCCCGRIYK